MSKIFKKEITTTISTDFVKCDKCNYETQVSNAIDNWCIIDNEFYCLKCQKKYKVSWFK
jgi:hypothetical protein